MGQSEKDKAGPMDVSSSTASDRGHAVGGAQSSRGGGAFVDFKLLTQQQQQQQGQLHLPMGHSAPASHGGSRVSTGKRRMRRRTIWGGPRHVSVVTRWLHVVDRRCNANAEKRKLTSFSFFFLFFLWDSEENTQFHSDALLILPSCEAARTL